MSEFPFGNVVCGGCNQMVAPVEKHNGRWYCLRCHYNLIKSDLAAVTKERDELKEHLEKVCSAFKQWLDDPLTFKPSLQFDLEEAQQFLDKLKKKESLDGQE